MDFFISKDGLTRATPEETKITMLTAKPRSDGKRVLVNMQITPFQKRPSLEVKLINARDEEVASTNILETLGFKLEFTMHVRGEIHNPHTLIAKLYYLEGPVAEPYIISLDVVPSSEPDKENFPE
ncbi:MAG: hypothetical protein UZ14_CFX002000433 [Chloroflexi bacterium OLB14]|nr:MAG: hypothetical protein UZ14_CFX002000433 [Chloroflexi bacterium OLB14]